MVCTGRSRPWADQLSQRDRPAGSGWLAVGRQAGLPVAVALPRQLLVLLQWHQGGKEWGGAGRGAPRWTSQAAWRRMASAASRGIPGVQLRFSAPGTPPHVRLARLTGSSTCPSSVCDSSWSLQVGKQRQGHVRVSRLCGRAQASGEQPGWVALLPESSSQHQPPHIWRSSRRLARSATARSCDRSSYCCSCASMPSTLRGPTQRCWSCWRRSSADCSVGGRIDSSKPAHESLAGRAQPSELQLPTGVACLAAWQACNSDKQLGTEIKPPTFRGAAGRGSSSAEHPLS